MKLVLVNLSELKKTTNKRRWNVLLGSFINSHLMMVIWWKVILSFLPLEASRLRVPANFPPLSRLLRSWAWINEFLLSKMAPNPVEKMSEIFVPQKSPEEHCNGEVWVLLGLTDKKINKYFFLTVAWKKTSPHIYKVAYLFPNIQGSDSNVAGWHSGINEDHLLINSVIVVNPCQIFEVA